jgi:hypothetical protein
LPRVEDTEQFGIKTTRQLTVYTRAILVVMEEARGGLCRLELDILMFLYETALQFGNTRNALFD